MSLCNSTTSHNCSRRRTGWPRPSRSCAAPSQLTRESLRRTSQRRHHLSNLAQVLQAQNRLTEAEPLMRCALASFERSLGKEHPDVAVLLNNIASVLYATNRMSEAEPLLRRALAIDEKGLGQNIPM